MAGAQYTYMLLPNFDYKPDEHIKLGTLLPLDQETKIPDPSNPLNDDTTRSAPAESDIRKETDEPKGKPWSYDGSANNGISGGIWASIPVLSTLSFGFSHERSNGHDLKIKCWRVDTECFKKKPSNEYVSKAIGDELVKEYLGQHWKPSVYMVTGIKTGYRATIEYSSRKARNTKGEFAVDATGANVPLKVGPRGEVKIERNDTFRTEKPGPFILAYQLKRIRVKGDGSFAISGYNKHSFLFDDQKKMKDVFEPSTLEEFWDIEDVSLETQFDD